MIIDIGTVALIKKLVILDFFLANNHDLIYLFETQRKSNSIIVLRGFICIRHSCAWQPIQFPAQYQ